MDAAQIFAQQMANQQNTNPNGSQGLIGLAGALVGVNPGQGPQGLQRFDTQGFFNPQKMIANWSSSGRGPRAGDKMFQALTQSLQQIKDMNGQLTGGAPVGGLPTSSNIQQAANSNHDVSHGVA